MQGLDWASGPMEQVTEALGGSVLDRLLQNGTIARQPCVSIGFCWIQRQGRPSGAFG